METDKQGFFRDMQRLAEEYVGERFLLIKLQAAEKAAQLSAAIFRAALIGIFVLLILMLLSVMACIYLVSLTQSLYLGIGLVILFYGLLVGCLIFFRKKMMFGFISDAVIRLLFKNDE